MSDLVEIAIRMPTKMTLIIAVGIFPHVLTDFVTIMAQAEVLALMTMVVNVNTFYDPVNVVQFDQKQ